MKKILSFVLVLAMILGCTSMAFAAATLETSVTKENTVVPFEDAETNAMATVLRDLGILDGTGTGKVELDKTIDRASFCKILMVALGYEDLCVKQETKFSDVPASHWASGYIAVANQKGYVDGVGNGMFNPSGAVSGTEAVAFVVKALGYQQEHLDGVWPTNYLTIATELNLFKANSAYGTKKLAATADEVTRAYAFQILFNALDKKQVVWNEAIGNTAGHWAPKTQAYDPENGGLTLLSNVMGEDGPVLLGEYYFVEAAGVLQANAATDNEDKNGFDYSKYVGQKIGVLYKNTKNGPVAIGLASPKSTTIEGTFAADLAEGVVNTIAGITVKAGAYVATSTNLIENGEKTASPSTAITSKVAVSLEAEKDADGNIVTINSISYDYMNAKVLVSTKAAADFDACASKVALEGYNGGTFNFVYDTTAKAIKAGSYTLEGVDKLEDIDAKAVVEVYLRGTTKTISKLIVTKNEIDDTFTSMTKKNGTETYKIGDKDYKVAKTTAGAVLTEYNGTSVYAFYLDKDGAIAASKLYSEDDEDVKFTWVYAFVLDTYEKGEKKDGDGWKYGVGEANTSSYGIKLVDFGASEEVKYVVPSKAALLTDGSWNSSLVAGSIVKYGIVDDEFYTMAAAAADFDKNDALMTPGAYGINELVRYAKDVKLVSINTAKKVTEAAYYAPADAAKFADKGFDANEIYYAVDKAGYITNMYVSGAGVASSITTEVAIALVAATQNLKDKTTFASIIVKGEEKEVPAKDYEAIKAKVAGIYTATFDAGVLATLTDLDAFAEFTTSKGLSYDGFGHIAVTGAAVAEGMINNDSAAAGDEFSLENKVTVLVADAKTGTKTIEVYGDQTKLAAALEEAVQVACYKTAETGYVDVIVIYKK